jgi:hypothetical protein
MRPAALTALAAGAAASVGFTLFAGRHAGWPLELIMSGWVIAPFLAVLWANVLAKRWPLRTQSMVHWFALALAAGSVAVYIFDAVRPPRPQAAFLFVVTPMVSWAAIAIAAVIVARGIFSAAKK